MATVTINDTAYSVPVPVALAIDHLNREVVVADTLAMVAEDLRTVVVDSVIPAADSVIEVRRIKAPRWRRAIRA
jgi:hypothetical protein